MPNIKIDLNAGLNDIINKSISKHDIVKELSKNIASVYDGNVIYDVTQENTTGIFRWGFSKWGVDVIIGKDFPES